MFDANLIRKDFPILERQVWNRPLVYLDNAATTQKPVQVLDCIEKCYREYNSNVHRGIHFLSQESTRLLEEAREKVRSFINAPSTDEIIFTRGTTESLNLLATCFSQRFLKAGDEIILSGMEHHSNIVPWQIQAERVGYSIRVIPVLDNGELDMEAFRDMLSDRTRLVSVTWVSNVLGTVNPVGEIIRTAHEKGIPVVLDGAQAVPHTSIDVQALDVDFLAFSGHKIYGPTGTGVLYGKRELLEAMPPYQGGGEMIGHVSFESTTFNSLPYKFEAGTPDYVGSIALGAAIDYVQALGMDDIRQYENSLLEYACQGLRTIPGMRFIGNAAHRSGVVSFLVGDIFPSDMGTLLDHLGIAVRTGHHCAQPLMERFGIQGTVRASVSFYNTKADIDALVAGVDRVRGMF